MDIGALVPKTHHGPLAPLVDIWSSKAGIVPLSLSVTGAKSRLVHATSLENIDHKPFVLTQAAEKYHGPSPRISVVLKPTGALVNG